MPIMPNPLQLKAPDLPGSDRKRFDLLWTSVERCAQIIRALLSGRVFEYHEDEIVDSTGQSIIHSLGRVPRGYLITYRDGNRVVYADRQRWTDTRLYMQTGAGSIKVSFFLFALFMALASPVAHGAECAAYGYAQAQPVRFWLCDLATDTTTDAVEGDYRWNKDANTFQCYTGAAWGSCGLGGGGSTPTGTGYVHVTAGVQDAAADLVTLTSATDVAANQGTTTTVLHGNAAGNPSWANVASVDFGANILGLANGGTGLDTSATPDDRVLVSAPWTARALANGALAYSTATNLFAQAAFTDVSGTLALAQLTDDASSGLCLLSGGGGDPAWTACPGGGGGLSYAQVAAAALAGF